MSETTPERRVRRVRVGSAPVARAIAVSVLGALFAFVVLAVVGSWAIRSAATSESIKDAADLGATAGKVSFGPYVTDALVNGDQQAIRELDRVVRTYLAGGVASRVKVWATDGTVLYSDEPALIGQKFELDNRELGAALNGAGVVADVSNLSNAENVLERPDGKLLEVYFGMRTAGGRPVMVETYYPYALVQHRAANIRSRFLPLMLLVLGVLAVVQLPLTARLALRLRRNQAERERLLERVINVSDAERRRIAAEVHDGAVQDLIGVSYSLAGVASAAPADLAPALDNAAVTTRRTIRELRNLLTSMYPIEVPDGGFAEGIDDLVGLLERDGVNVTVDMPRKLRLAPVDEVMFLRTARELLRNVHEHASAQNVTVKVSGGAGRPTLEITDDGVGFTAEVLEQRRQEAHFGLRLLEDLAVDAGGTLTIDSRPGKGTCARLRLEARS